MVFFVILQPVIGTGYVFRTQLQLQIYIFVSKIANFVSKNNTFCIFL